jgi:hypothetical protein
MVAGRGSCIGRAIVADAGICGKILERTLWDEGLLVVHGGAPVDRVSSIAAAHEPRARGAASP